MRSACALPTPILALKSGRCSRGAFWLLPTALVLGLLAAAPRVAAQSAKLAQMPPPPSAWTSPPSNPAGSSASAGDSSPQPSADESSSKADAGESSSKADDSESSSSSSSKGGPDDNYNPDDSLTPPSPNRPSLRRRGAPAGAADPAVPDQPAFDPLHADRSLDVGEFYFKKGQYDAAIDRYQEAAQLNPKMAKPYLLLGEAYEKKNATAEALKAYRKYLEMFAAAPDRAKVQERIDKLQGKAGRSG